MYRIITPPPAESQGDSETSNPSPHGRADRSAPEGWRGIERLPSRVTSEDSAKAREVRAATSWLEDSGLSPSKSLSQPKLITSAPTAAINEQIDTIKLFAPMTQGLCA